MGTLYRGAGGFPQPLRLNLSPNEASLFPRPPSSEAEIRTHGVGTGVRKGPSLNPSRGCLGGTGLGKGLTSLEFLWVSLWRPDR